MAFTFFTAATANGSSPALQRNPDDRETRKGMLYITGTFNSCTVTVEVSKDGTNYFAVNSAAYTAQQVSVFEWYAKYMRLTISSAGASTSINAWIE